VQQGAASAGPSATTVSVTLGANVTAGNRLVVVAMAYGASFGNQTSSVTDTAGNTYVELQSIRDGVNANEESIWTAPITSGGGTTPTLTATITGCTSKFCQGNAVAVVVLEYSGLASVADASVVDQQISSTGSTSAADVVSSGATVATAAPNELAIGVYADAFSRATVTPGSGWTAEANDTPCNGLSLVVADQKVPQGARPNVSFAVSQATPWMAGTVVFKLGP
jgi:hypothetical protein